MQLDKIIIALRERTGWEAMDLGVKVMRKLWPVIIFPWLIMISLVLVVTLTAQSQGYLFISLLFMWWIKPIYDSLILHILSRGIFGDYVTVSDVYTSMSPWLKTGLKTTLFFWRLSVSRSFNMPVNQLEGLSGRARKERLQALHRVSTSHSMAATIIGVHFEYLIAMTLYAVIFYIAPDTSMAFFETAAEHPEKEMMLYMLGTVLYAITLFILEPFYVAAGFMLYLNRRTQLEGWDIELDFRRMAQRIQEPYGQLRRESSGA